MRFKISKANQKSIRLRLEKIFLYKDVVTNRVDTMPMNFLFTLQKKEDLAFRMTSFSSNN